MKNAAISTATIVDPTGVEQSIEVSIPITAQATEIIAEHTMTARKLLNNLIADNAGNIMSAVINSEPTRFIASTIIIAVITAIRRL